MPFLHKNVSTKVAKTYTFVTEVIRNTVEMARSIAEVISMRASAIPTWMKRIQKTLASSDGSALVAMTAMAAGKQVFLRAATVTTTVMTSMTSEDTTDKKRPSAVKKVRLSPVKKEIGSVEIVSV